MAAAGKRGRRAAPYTPLRATCKARSLTVTSHELQTAEQPALVEQRRQGNWLLASRAGRAPNAQRPSLGYGGAPNVSSTRTRSWVGSRKKYVSLTVSASAIANSSAPAAAS